MPTALAIVRRLQCVASGGVSVLVFDDPGDHRRAERRLARRARRRGTSRPRPQHSAFASAEPSACHSQAPLNHGGSHPVASQQHDLCATDMLLWRYCRWRSTPPTCPVSWILTFLPMPHRHQIHPLGIFCCDRNTSTQSRKGARKTLTFYRHARTCSGHLVALAQAGAPSWMAGTSPAMTKRGR